MINYGSGAKIGFVLKNHIDFLTEFLFK